MKDLSSLEYYAIAYNDNTHKIDTFNIFHSVRFVSFLTKDIQKMIDKKSDYDTFKELLRKDLFSAFASKVEYEVYVGDAFEKDLNKYSKIDVYNQVLPNIDILADYILNNIFESY